MKNIMDKIYNFYNGLLGKKVSQMLECPRIDKFIENGIEKEYVVTASSIRKPKYVRATKTNYLHYKLNELKSLIVLIQQLSKKYGKFTKEACPLEMVDEHYRLSRILMENESYEWECPFCNEKFQT